MPLYGVHKVYCLSDATIGVLGRTGRTIGVARIADLPNPVDKNLLCLFWRKIIAIQEGRFGVRHRPHLCGLFLKRHPAQQIADAIFNPRLGIAIYRLACYVSHCSYRHRQSS